jgi:hypothetical protein
LLLDIHNAFTSSGNPYAAAAARKKEVRVGAHATAARRARKQISEVVTALARKPGNWFGAACGYGTVTPPGDGKSNAPPLRYSRGGCDGDGEFRDGSSEISALAVFVPHRLVHVMLPANTREQLTVA